MKHTIDIVLYDLPYSYEDRKAIWKAVKSMSDGRVFATGVWDWDFVRQTDRMSCSAYGTNDELADIKKRIRRLSRGKIRFQFEIGADHPRR